ncbi:hypothetical protein CMI47_15240 [Candidatus Pacearchaeota archaeon]|nr:hypothetical protein [Candidatus Pacearchaeota archaeon]|tara:strand:- start:4919 stop:5533 length:615 start_codon:yes stop_codon:yes gene_type:complete
MVKNNYDVVAFLCRPYGLLCLDALVNSRFRPELLFTHKYERVRASDGEKIVRPELDKFREVASREGIELYTPTKEKMIGMLGERDYDFLVSVHCSFVFPPEVFEKARIGAVNIHPSIAVDREIKYKGADPVKKALEADERKVGVSIHRISEGIDEGEVLGCRTERVSEGDDVKSLSEKLGKHYPLLLMDALERLRRPQDGFIFW